MNDLFQSVFLVSLKRRPDRLAAALEELHSHDWPFREPEVFAAIDGQLVPCPYGWKAGGGAWGCRQSHVAILQRCINEQIEPVLVLEDDLCLRSTFREDCEQFFRAVPKDWEGLMLGGQHMVEPRPVKPGVVRCMNTQRTHAYAVHGRLLRDLYSLWAAPRQVQHIDWTMGPIHCHYRVYAPDPFVIGQARSHSDICGRTNPAKFWEQPTGNEPVLLLDCDRETMEGLREYCIHTGYDRGPDGIDNGLRRVFQSEDIRGELRKWINDLQWECVSCEGMVLGVWHPQVTAELLQECWAGPVHVVRSVDDAIPLLAREEALAM